jgi:hypothetical protein
MLKYLITAIILLLTDPANAAECTLYEKSHPTFLLNGAHLSTGKCSTCASCHKGGIFMGTPKSCVTCHNGDPRWATIGRSAKHIPTFLVECNNCHTTTAFTPVSSTQFSHISVATYRCDSCHNGAYRTPYGALGKSSDHPTTATVGGVKVSIAGWDCNHSGCHTTKTFSK